MHVNKITICSKQTTSVVESTDNVKTLAYLHYSMIRSLVSIANINKSSFAIVSLKHLILLSGVQI